MDSRVFHRSLNQMPVTAAHSDSYWIKTAYGGRRIDISSGAGVTCLGHNAQGVKDAMVRAIDAMPYVHSGSFTHTAAETLARLITAEAGDGFMEGAVFFLSGGAEAVEAACKVGAQYHAEVRPEADTEFFARQGSYHGATTFALELGDHPRKNMHKWISNSRVKHFLTLQKLEEDLRASVANKVVIVETVGGTAVGIEPNEPRYLASIRELCNEHHAVLIFDEILCGNFRTGHLFAWQALQDAYAFAGLNLHPDIVVFGKGITAGYFPLSGVLVSDQIRQRIKQGSGTLWHSSTNQNHPIGCAAGVAAFAAYKDHARQIKSLIDTLRYDVVPYLKQSEEVRAIDGIGTLWGIKLAVDVERTKLHGTLMDAGIAAYCDGGRGAFVLLAPPYCMDAATLHDAALSLRGALEKL